MKLDDEGYGYVFCDDVEAIADCACAAIANPWFLPILTTYIVQFTRGESIHDYPPGGWPYAK